ncbi:MAG: zinc-ribbon domain-containing protein [Lachnospiraceae bacterium]|nr:zinc-ribbon domain-containing protein [Lachnospiraceae bacterium]
MRCPKCGREIPDNSKLCRYCGNPIAEIRIDLDGGFSGTGVTDQTKIIPETGSRYQPDETSVWDAGSGSRGARIPEDGTDYDVTGYADDPCAETDTEDSCPGRENAWRSPDSRRSGNYGKGSYREGNRDYRNENRGNGGRNRDRSSGKRKKSGKGKLVACLLCIAAALIVILVLWWKLTHTGNSTPVVVSSSSAEDVDMSQYQNADLNGVDHQTVTADGTLLITADGQGFLQMDPPVSVFADTSDGKQAYLSTVRSLRLLPSGSTTVASVSEYSGQKIEVTGVLSINESQEPCLTLFQVIPRETAAAPTAAAVATATPTPEATDTPTPTPTVSPLTPDKTSAVTAEPTSTPTASPTAAPSPTEEAKTTLTYRLVSEDCTWEQAFQEAKNAGGRLAAVDSEEKYRQIISQIQSQGLTGTLFYVGGRRSPSDMNYYWVNASNQTSGEAIENFWAAGEPDATEEETASNGTVVLIGSDGLHDGDDNYLSAHPDQSGRIGYIIEIDS